MFKRSNLRHSWTPKSFSINTHFIFLNIRQHINKLLVLLSFERHYIQNHWCFLSLERDYTKKPSVLSHKPQKERDMGLLELATGFNIAVLLVFFLFLITLRVLFSCWISPTLKYWKIRRNGFGGPTPSFPFGNIKDIVKMSGDSSLQSSNSPHDIHSNVFPYFAQWQKSHGELLAS